MAFSNYLEKKLLEAAFRNVAYTLPTTVYVALFTAIPAGDGTGGTEVSGGSYARQAVTFGAATGGSPTTVTNSALVQYPTATANWGTIVGAGIYDAATAGNLMEMGSLTTSKTVNSGDSFAFPVGTYSISLS